MFCSGQCNVFLSLLVVCRGVSTIFAKSGSSNFRQQIFSLYFCWCCQFLKIKYIEKGRLRTDDKYFLLYKCYITLFFLLKIGYQSQPRVTIYNVAPYTCMEAGLQACVYINSNQSVPVAKVFQFQERLPINQLLTHILWYRLFISRHCGYCCCKCRFM